MPHDTAARLKFGDGGVGEVEHAADIKVGIAGCRGALTAFASEADIPAKLRKGASESLSGSWISYGLFWQLRSAE